MLRRSFLALVTGGLAGQAVAQPRRAFSCSDADRRDPSWTHGADRDSGPRGDPVLRFLHQDGADRAGVSDAPNHRRRRPQVRCPRKRQIRARG